MAQFLGIMGVVPATVDAVHSVPPGRHGGNHDVTQFYVSDPHFSQGDGEVAPTAFEAPLRATVQSRLHTDPAIRRLAGTLTAPWGQTDSRSVVMGLDPSLDGAMQHATRNAIAFLTDRFALPPAVALAYLSAAADFDQLL